MTRVKSAIASTQRCVPASVSVEFGRGNSTNEELANLALARGGGTVEFDGNTEFGGSVRFPIKPRLSIDLELFRLQATEADNLPGTDREHATFTASALPLVANLVWVVRAAPRWRVNAVGGVGLMLVSQAVLQYQHEHFGRPKSSFLALFRRSRERAPDLLLDHH